MIDFIPNRLYSPYYDSGTYHKGKILLKVWWVYHFNLIEIFRLINNVIFYTNIIT